MRWLLFALAILVSVFAFYACDSTQASGACNGNMDGTYFQTDLYNYVVDADLEVRLNGRFIGNIPRGADNGDGTVTPGRAKLGDFPTCDAHVIDARGSDGGFTQKFCSTSVIESSTCKATKADYCYLIFGYLPDSGNPPAVFPPPGAGSPDCQLAPSPTATVDSNGQPTVVDTYPCAAGWVTCS